MASSGGGRLALVCATTVLALALGGHRSDASCDGDPAACLLRPDATSEATTSGVTTSGATTSGATTSGITTSDRSARTAVDEGRGKMKKTMGMMMTAAAMKAMMVIPLALGVLFLMAGKAMIISKIALVLSLIITLKKLISKSGAEHVVHESHSSAASAWPSAGSPVGYGGGGGGGWAKRSSPVAGHVLAYGSYRP